jgi:hypothetical protein
MEMGAGGEQHDDTADDAGDEEPPLSDRLEAWLTGDHEKTTGDLVDRFGTQSFAILFVILLAVPALPIPTGGITHLLEIVAMLLALELIFGRDEVWIPERWNHKALPALSRPAFANALLKRVRWFERFARPRGSRILGLNVTRILYGVVVLVLTVVAFFAPPFSGLDTLPSLGVVILSLGMLFGDAVVAAAGVVIGTLGVALVIGLGHAVSKLF